MKVNNQLKKQVTLHEEFIAKKLLENTEINLEKALNKKIKQNKADKENNHFFSNQE